LYDIIYSGKNSMPGYGINCTPKGACTFGARFTDEEVERVAKYVLEQAKNGWKVGE
jgi:cytochrome c6